MPCYFVADLHLFANRSVAHRYREEIGRAAAKATTFVLGGDIFDFRWSRHASTGHAVDEAIAWLSALAAESPRCHFHFLLGNHDYHQGLIDRLADLQRKTPNLSWHPFYFRQGWNIFIHGDAADRKTTGETLADRRARWLHHRRRGRTMNRLYDLVVATRLHGPWPYVIYRRRVVAKRILAYLRDIGQGPEQGVRHVYFGHIHRPMADYRYGGLVLHNCGAPIKGSRFRILKAVPSR